MKRLNEPVRVDKSEMAEMEKLHEKVEKELDLSFFPFVEKDNDTRASQDGATLVEVCCKSLNELLRVSSFAAFLSVVLCNESLKKFLDSFLELRSRPWDVGSETSPQQLREELEDCVLAVLHRAVVDNEGREELREEFSQVLNAFGRELKTAGVISAPRAFDVAALYLERKPKAVKEVIVAMLNLDAGIQLDVIGSIREMKSKVLPGIARDLTTSSFSAQEDLLSYARDIAITLGNFVTAVGIKQGSELFGKAFSEDKPLLEGFCKDYDIIVKALAKGLPDLLAKQRLEDFRSGLTLIIHVVLCDRFWIPLNVFLLDEEQVGSDGLGNPQGRIEELLDFMIRLQKVDDEGRLGSSIGDYEHRFKLSERLDALADMQIAIESSEGLRYAASAAQSFPKSIDSEHSAVRKSTASSGSSKRIKKKKEKEEIREKIRSVKEILPDLGSYFVEQLLYAVGGDVELAVQRVIENNIPEAILHVDRDMETVPLKPVEKDPEDALELLDQIADEDDDDDGELQVIKERVRELAAQYDMEYGDDYDDAYDDAGFEVGDDGALVDKPFDANKWKPGMADIDGIKRDKHGKVVKEGEGEETDNDLMKPNLNHLVTPPSNTKRKTGRKPPPVAAATVAADAKSSDATASQPASARSRKFKDKNKARIANHSRKKGAAKKQAKSMFGS